MIWVTMPALIGPADRAAARRLHHHLHLLALDLPHQHADRARRHRAGDDLHRGRQGGDARPVRPAAAPCSPASASPGWPLAARCSAWTSCRWPIVLALIAIGAAVDLRLCACMRGARRRRSSICRCCRSRRCAPRWSAASSTAAASARCRSCCRCCLQLGFGLTAFQSGLITRRQRVRRHGHEDHDPDHPAALRLPRGADGERAGQRRAWSGSARPSRPACRSPGSSACCWSAASSARCEFTSLNTIAYADIDPRT